jgi:carbon monoxide dehydrogenase subunit G
LAFHCDSSANDRKNGPPVGIDLTMRIEGHFVVSAPRQIVWTAIKDPAVVAPCIPGCQGVEVLSPTLYKARIRVAVGPIKAEFNVEVEILAETEPEELRSRTRGEEGGRASSLSAESTLRLTSLGENETEVSYSSEATVVGRLGKFGLGIMKKKAESLGREFAANFKWRVEEPSPPA